MTFQQAPELLEADESLPPTKEADIYACGMVRYCFLPPGHTDRASSLDDAGLYRLRQIEPPSLTIK